MKANELLFEARRRGIKLWAAEDRLRYDAPAGAMDRELREALRSNREEVLALLRQSRVGPLPLSFAQERLWFMRELAPDSPFYNVPAKIRLRGSLDVERLRDSFSRLVARHETLRTTFSEEGQRIGEPREVQIPLIDFEGLEGLEGHDGLSETESARVANEEASRVFDLGRGPLLRARLLRLSRDEHLLALTLHHIVSDGWSMNVLLQELGEIYDALSSGREPQLPALEIQYADYATWQRERLSGELLERGVELWRRKLENLPALALPSDRPRPAALSYRGGREWLSLPRDLSARVRDLARSEGVTLYATLLSAFLLLLHRYTGEEDVFVGSPFAGRGLRELEGLIGFFVNSLVLRADLSGDPPFRELLSHVAENARDGFAHQEVPFERLVEELEPDRDLGKNPLFQVVFALQNAPETSRPMGGLEVEWGWAETGATRFDLEAHVWDDGSDLRLAFVYSSDLYEASTIRRMERHYQRLLEWIVEEPGRRISEIHYIEDVERYRVLVAWNETKTSYPRAATIHELFEEQASRR
ncbi:MAG: condensation domain-containing protein, partial [Vicinamibacteria bacterium]